MIQRLFADDRRFWPLATLLLGLCAVLKGLRPPNRWAMTEAQLDYSHGFLKRGLLGEILKHLGGHHAHTLAVIFFLELAAFAVALLLFARSARLADRFASPALPAAFASSFIVTYLTHLVGYTDILNGLLTLLLLLLRDPTRRFVAALVLLPVAFLLHENFLVLFFPALLYSFYLDSLASPRRRMALYAALLSLLAVGMALLTALNHPLSLAESTRFCAEVAARVDFPPDAMGFTLLSRSMPDLMRLQLHLLGGAFFWREVPASLADLLPLLLITIQCLRLALRNRHSRETTLVTAAVLLAPFAMYFLGWDFARWTILAGFNSCLVLFLSCRTAGPQPTPLSPAWQNAILLAIALNMASGYNLFDGKNITPYPFFPHLF